MSALELVSLALIFWATSGALTFVVLYALLAPWWHTREGRHVMLLTLGLTALGVTSLLRRAVGEWPGYDVTVSAIYAVIAWELWFQVWLLLTARRHRRRPQTWPRRYPRGTPPPSAIRHERRVRGGRP